MGATLPTSWVNRRWKWGLILLIGRSITVRQSGGHEGWSITLYCSPELDGISFCQRQTEALYCNARILQGDSLQTSSRV